MPKIRRNDGVHIGRSASEKVALFGAEPVAQPSGANQGALIDNSGGTASLTIAAIGATYTQAEVRNAVASLARSINQIRSDLVTLGVIKGAA